MLLNLVARPLLAAVSVANGIETLINPKAKIESTAPLLAKAPVNPALAVQAGAAVQIVAGLLMALGRAPRVAAMVLAADMLPTTVAENPFSAPRSPDARANFLSNCGMLAGLLLAIAAPAGKRRRKRR